jgi:hypothetical protein
MRLVRRLRAVHLLFVMVAAVVAALVALVISQPTAVRSREKPDPDEMIPGALERHVDRLRALPGNGGESGPGSAAEENFFQRAFPDDDIPLERITASRAAFDAHGDRFARGRGRAGTWVTVGPSNAIYPFFDLRTSALYVPNEYAAGGRTTAVVIDPNCTPGHCRLWIGAAGGGIWRTKNALTGQPSWEYLSGSFGINSIGTMTLDPNDATGNTLWVGTGESHACGSGCVAGVGIYKSTDGGDTWTGPLGNAVFNGRGIASIAVSTAAPNTIFAATGRALLGHSSVCCGGAVTLIPGAAPWGLYRSTDGGGNWSLVHNGAATVAGCTSPTAVANNLTPCSPRGVTRVAIDPNDANTIYAGSFARGVWRSSDNGNTWSQIFAPVANGPAGGFIERPEIAVTLLPNGKTRMYLGIGQNNAATNPNPTPGGPAFAIPSQFFRSDDVRTGAPTFMVLSSPSPANPGYGAHNYCTGQCWYDNYVMTPSGHPDMVYLLGSYQYGETGRVSNGRAVVLSTDAGASFNDMTMDATDAVHPNAIHPDQHAIVVNPNNPFQFFEGSDGGVVRSSGEFVDASANCVGRPVNAVSLARCQQLLSRVPSQLQSMNKGLTTLQFQSLSVSPADANILQGGTQDNGTWQSMGNQVKWTNTMIGDGGQSGFDVANTLFRFHTFAGQQPDVNFSGGEVADWNWIGDPFFIAGADPFAAFYFPIISDPTVTGSLYAGIGHIWRTKTHGLGAMSVADLRAHCNEWTGDFPATVTCGDWVKLGDPAATGRLTATTYGPDKIAAGSNNYVAAVERTSADNSTLWAATSGGRVFISKNADAEPSSTVVFTRIDTVGQPGRFPTSIYIDSANSNHGWVSFSGFGASTPAAPGHVYEVTFNPATMTAAWTDRSYDFGDLPVTDLVRDEVTGDLYASSDFGVSRLGAGTTTWTLAASGMPNAEVAGLTIVPGARKLYAAGHGLGAWLLNLSK